MMIRFFNSRRISKKLITGLVMSLLYIIAGNISAAITFNDSLVDALIDDAAFGKALEIIRQYKNENISNEQKSLLDIKTCKVFLQSGDIPGLTNALSNLEISIKNVDYHNHQIYFEYALLKGKYYLFLAKLDPALTWLKIAEKQAGYLDNLKPGLIASLFAEYGRYYYYMQDDEKAIVFYQKAIDILRKNPLKYPQEIAYSASLASILGYDHLEQSAALIRKCSNYFNNTTNHVQPAFAFTFLTMAEYYINIGTQISSAENLLQDATIILNAYYPKDHCLYGVLYYLKSKVKYHKHDYENALHYNIQSLKVASLYPFLFSYQISNYSIMASAYYWYAHDYKKTINCCNLGIALIKNNRQSSAYLHYLIGLSNLRLGNQKQAETIFNQLIAHIQERKCSSDFDLLVNVYITLGQIASKDKKSDRVFYWLNQALDVTKKTNHNNELLKLIHYHTAKAYYFFKQDYSRALEEIQKSIISGCTTFADIRPESNPPLSDILFGYSMIESFSLKAYLFYLLYDQDKQKLYYLENAMKCQELSVKLYERIIIGINEENSGLNLVNLKVTALNNAVSYANLLYQQTKKPEYAEKAFEYTEKSKMQLLLIKTLKENNLRRSGVPDSVIRQEQQLNNSIVEIENSIVLNNKTGKNPIVNDHLTRELSMLYDQRDVLIQSLEKKFPNYYKAKYSFNVSGIKKIQSILKSNEVILEYQLLNTELITFVISRNDFKIFYCTIDHQLFDQIHNLHHSVSMDNSGEPFDQSFNSFIHSSYYLYDKLIRPVYKNIAGKHLIIIPHNELTQIPFEVLISSLPAKKSPNFRSLQYLIKEFPIIYAYSANLLLEKNRDKKFGRGTAIFIPDYGSYQKGAYAEIFYQLKGAENEATAIKLLSHGKIFCNELASEASFKKYAKGYGILHIASHTMLDDANPMLSCMVMTNTADTADDGKLYTYEISQMKLDAQLVVLSGCNTGFGVLRKSEGLISIARSFFCTGVQTIAYTLWPVADNAGSTLIGRFYKEIKRKKPLDEAMRNAKLDFIESADPVKSHPYYWANYMLLGNTDAINLNQYPGWSKTLLFAVGLSLILFMVYRKIIS
jgi:CHAT domain-containing protein